jgi:DNA-binding transcriptional MerR regulator
MGFISRAEVLKLFDISVWTLRRWQRERHFPDAIAASGKVRLYRKSEVQDWIINQAENAVKE